MDVANTCNLPPNQLIVDAGTHAWTLGLVLMAFAFVVAFAIYIGGRDD